MNSAIAWRKSKIWIVSFCFTLGLALSSNAATEDHLKVLHALNRISLGIRPGDIEKVKSMGLERYIQAQLSPKQEPLPSTLAQRLAQLDTLQMTPLQLQQIYGQRSKEATPEERKTYQLGLRKIMQQALQARLLRATESPRQLEEVMVEFWFNHFNIFANKGQGRLWVGSYEETAIRPHVLGKFRTLLEATARHPAMLVYLDNWQNTAPGSPGARGRLQGLNENYARELMELHTLGVDGGYTQTNVTTLAKILTGWGIHRGKQAGADASGFYFDAKRHDFIAKVFLGRTIKGSGETEVEQALDMLSASPVTAKHISYELAQYFVADQPPASLVNQLTQQYLKTGSDIRAVLEALFQSSEFWNPKVYGANGNAGTDHGHGNAMWVMGGNVEGGQVYGQFPGLQTNQLHQGRDLAITTDFRAVMSSLLIQHLQLSPVQIAKIFPGYKAPQPLSLIKTA